MKKKPNESSDGNSQKLKKLFSITGMMILIIMLTFAQTFAQQGKTIKGNVIDNAGVPLPGVSVVVKGTTTGTITNLNGSYTLAVPATGKVLVFSFLGMKATEVAVVDQTQINVTMAEETYGLSEMVVVAYGTQPKATLTGAVDVVSNKALENRATTNVGLALQGQTPGLVVTRTSPRPGNEGLDFVIRGQSSVNGSKPLVIIDGVPALNDYELLLMR